MSKEFDLAATQMAVYMQRQANVADNTQEPLWFTSAAAATSFADLADTFDAQYPSNEAETMQIASMQADKTTTTYTDLSRIRQQMLFMASASQALRRRYLATGASRLRGPLDALRYEIQRKITAAGLYFALSERLKDPPAPAAPAAPAANPPPNAAA